MNFFICTIVSVKYLPLMFLRGLNIIVLPLVQPWLSVVLKSCGLLLQLSFLLVCSRIGPQTWHKPDAYLLNESMNAGLWELPGPHWGKWMGSRLAWGFNRLRLFRFKE